MEKNSIIDNQQEYTCKCGDPEPAMTMDLCLKCGSGLNVRPKYQSQCNCAGPCIGSESCRKHNIPSDFKTCQPAYGPSPIKRMLEIAGDKWRQNIFGLTEEDKKELQDALKKDVKQFFITTAPLKFIPPQEPDLSKEKELLAMSASMWNKFLTCPQQHPNEREEFKNLIHQMQNLIGIRIARKLTKGIFSEYE